MHNAGLYQAFEAEYPDFFMAMWCSKCGMVPCSAACPK